MRESSFDLTISIVGLGLIGGSYAKALKELKAKKIYGIDSDKKTLDKALKMGIIDEGFTCGTEAIKKSDLIIIALYPEDTIKFVEDHRFNFKSGAVITDTCGIKQRVMEKINSFLPGDVDFIGAHPMAGKESKGLDAASKDIFKDCNYIITPQERNSEKNILIIEEIAKSLGSKNIIKVSAKEHDRIISFTSHLPHIIAVSLMNPNICYGGMDRFSGGSFRDATRVANINPQLWSQLFMLNSCNLINEIEKFEKILGEIKQAVELQDQDSLEHILANATLRRREMVLK